MTALFERKKMVFLAGVFQLCFFHTDSSCDFPAEIQGTWFGKRTILTIGHRSYNESGSHSNGQNQVVIADCVQRQHNMYLLSTPTIIDGLIFIGYLCWSYVKINRNVLLIYGKMANISQLSPSTNFQRPTVTSCPSSLNMFPNPPEEDAIGTYYAQELHSIPCPFIGRHQWNYGCKSGKSTLEACSYPYDTLEDNNRCRSPPSDYDESHIYKCIASWEGTMGVNYLLLSTAGKRKVGGNDHFCYAYTKHSNGVVKGAVQEFQCTSPPDIVATDQRIHKAIILQKVPNRENCYVTANASAVSTSEMLTGLLVSLVMWML